MSQDSADSTTVQPLPARAVNDTYPHHAHGNLCQLLVAHFVHLLLPVLKLKAHQLACCALMSRPDLQ